MPDLREALAAIQHDIWAHWMTYLFSRTGDGTALTYEHGVRWKRQIVTDYADLSEKAKDSDRHQADKILAVLEPYLAAATTKARHEEQARCVTLAHMTPIEEPSANEIEELDFTGGPLTDDGEAWAYYHAETIAQAIDSTCIEAVEYRAAKNEEEL